MAAWSAPNTHSHSSPAYPDGNCHYSDLSRGQDARSCQCRRFWLDRSRQLNSGESTEAAWCFCGHHACFHDQGPPAGSSLPRQDLLRPATAANEHSVDPERSDAFLLSHSTQQIRNSRVPDSSTHIGSAGAAQAIPQPGIWDALNAYARENLGDEVPRPSHLPSTASPSIPTSQSHNSPHGIMQHAREAGSSGRSPNVALDMDAMSATEMNTPSIDGGTFHPPMVGSLSPSKRAAASPMSVPNRRSELGNLNRRDAGPRSTISAGRQDLTQPRQEQHSIRELHNVISTCTKRLDLLESLSYKHVSLEEVEDQFEHLDNRLISLEEFRAELETHATPLHRQSPGTSKKRRPLPAEMTASFNSEDSFSRDSNGSGSSHISATAAVYAEYNGRFDDISQRLDAIEKAVPSVANPWRIEVVLLPWGRHLPGIWAPAASTGDEDDRHRHFREEWDGNMSAANDLFGQNARHPSGWSSDSIQAWAEGARDWLSPKACGPDSVVWHRLWSRGLIQHVEIDSPDAGGVMRRCATAFQHVRQTLTRQHTFAEKVEYDALREPLVPLRKVRKLSRLRFLAPSEMVSAALWNVGFLDTTVFMKAKGGQRRLYVTFPEAYVQQPDDGWTWRTIKDLRPARREPARSGPGFDGREHCGKGASCWTHHPVLDAPNPLSQCSTSSASHPPTAAVAGPLANDASSSQDASIPRAAIVSPVSQHRALRDHHGRTVSIPPSNKTGTPNSSGSVKRRVASIGTGTARAKKHCTSNSSDHARPGPVHTPRMSREPPSPFLSDHPVDSRSDNNSGRRIVLTPVAYETPHSHVHNALELLKQIDRYGDTDADTDIVGNEQSPWREDQGWYNEGHEALSGSLGGRGGCKTDRDRSESGSDEESDEGD